MLSEQPRRRKAANIDDKDGVIREKSAIRKRGRRRRKRIIPIGPTVIGITLLLVFCSLVCFQQTLRPQLVRGLLSHSRQRVELRYREIYDHAYGKKEDDRAQHDDELLEHVDFLSTNSYSLTQCSLTVVFMDPRIANAGHGQPVWFTLESVALHTDPETCFLIQTSSCRALNEDHVLHHIYYHALPHFRRVMEQHRTRVTFLQYTAYNMDSCDDFNPNAVFLNKHYWKDEFVDADSDIVLVVQADAVLCRDLNLGRWKRYAFIGAVWPNQASVNFPEPMEGMCRAMPARWKTWLRPQRKWEQDKQKQQYVSNATKSRTTSLLNSTLLPSTFPIICTNGIAPVGNGGLSLRNRTWMMRAIEACPHDRYSGHDLKLAGCNVLEKINEDFYFGIVLRGMNAPLPNGYEASLFSSETLWHEDVLDLYGGESTNITNNEIPTIVFKGRTLTVPTGFHKPWRYQSSELLLSDQLDAVCPLLRYVVDIEAS